MKSITLQNESKLAKIAIYALHVLCGSLFLSICSQIAVPIGPVPITLQTLGLFVLSGMAGSKKTGLAALLYLIEATLGMPVLAGWSSNPLWIFSMSSGFLISFPLAGFAAGYLLEKRKDFFWILLSLTAGQMIVYALGLGRLLLVLNLKQALIVGFFPFLIPGAVKTLLAAAFVRFYESAAPAA